ncbi:MAG TPA: recombinase family protein, partial [bacterium]|nr:recombinase family protein [bacterium]
MSKRTFNPHYKLYQNEGFRSRAGRKYHKSKIHKILGQSFYCGIMEKDGEKYLGKYEPIISKELFDNVQEVINKKAHVKHQVIPFAFRGILKCAKCGCQLTASKKKGRLTYYYCTNGKGNCGEHKAYLKEEDLSKELSGVFDDLLFDEELIELVYQAKLEEQDKSLSYFDESINSLKGRLKTLEERKNALLDGY